MSVPAHDQRDFEFAKKYDLDIVVVVNPPGKTLVSATMEAAYAGEGTMVNSGPFDDMDQAASHGCDHRGSGKKGYR